jgi:hypothetical protein
LLAALAQLQIDVLVLVLLLGALWASRAQARWLAGILWALAIVFKPHTLLALPFLLLRRQWAIAGSALAALALAISLASLAAPAITHEYLETVALRLARHGDDPPKSDLLPRETMRRALAGLSPQLASKQGRLYRGFGLEFDARGSLVWAVGGETPAHPGTLSLFFWMALSGLVLACRRPRADEPSRVGSPPALRNGQPTLPTPRASRAPSPAAHHRGRVWEPFQGSHSRRFAVEDLAWWQTGWCVVLLSAPLTWAMNATWLLPAGFVVAARHARWKQQTAGWLATASQVTAVLGLALATVPDRFAWPWPGPLDLLSPYKYVLGTALVAVAMVAGSRVNLGAPEVD